MVEQAAHDSLDECSNHSGLKLYICRVYSYGNSSSAGIGRQYELKIRWYFIVKVQVLSRINKLLDPIVKRLRHDIFNIGTWVRTPFGLHNVYVILLSNQRYSLIGKTTILHIVISGSRPDISR
jgi:hypothetical protein